MTVAFRIGRFGSSQADLIIQDRIVCPLIMMPNRIIEVLRSKYLVAPIHYEGMQRVEPLEIPEDGLREMICNAIIHKDYTGADIQMHVYHDHVEIWNQGDLPEGYDEKVLYGKHSSMPRNSNIADTMFKAGFIDTWGRGYKKIREGFEGAGLPMPKVENFCGGVRVSFLRGFDVVTGKKIVPSDVVSLPLVQLSDRQKEIREMILKDSFISAKQMSVVLSVDSRTVQRDLAAMQKMGILIREGNTSAGHWVIIQK